MGGYWSHVEHPGTLIRVPIGDSHHKYWTVATTPRWDHLDDVGEIYDRTGIRMDLRTQWTERASRPGTVHWYWHDDTLDRFDADQLCDGEFRSFLFVGDSLTQHFYLSFLSQLGVFPEGTPHPQPVVSHNMHHKTDCGLSFRYVRNDFMLMNKEALPYKSANANQPWVDHVGEADVILMNQGAHFLDVDTFKFNVGSALDYLRDKRVLYLGVPPGFPNCMDHNVPVEVFPDLSRARYHWGEISLRNIWVKHLIADSGRKGHHYVNLMDMSLKRADAHVSEKDCLHFTFPGVYDWWVYVVFNKITKIRF